MTKLFALQRRAAGRLARCNALQDGRPDLTPPDECEHIANLGTGARNKIFTGDCLDVLPTLPHGAFRACITSPPYAMQRQKQYGGISEEEYPQWTVTWMDAMAPTLTPDASVLIVIRSHIHGGQVSDYLLRTRLALRDAGWVEPEELIWLKTDGFPLGSTKRPRRTWEHILWLSRTANPYANLRACGRRSSRLGCVTSDRFAMLHGPQRRQPKSGISRLNDVIDAPVGGMARGVSHPAMFPQQLSDILVQTFSELGDCVIDPFLGSGTTALSAKRFGRHYCGIDRSEEYAEMAMARLGNGGGQ